MPHPLTSLFLPPSMIEVLALIIYLKKTKIEMTALQKCNLIFCFKLPYPLKFPDSLLLDLLALDALSRSEAIFSIKGQFDIGIFKKNCSYKRCQHSLMTWVLWRNINLKLHLWMLSLYIDTKRSGEIGQYCLPNTTISILNRALLFCPLLKKQKIFSLSE